MSLFINTGNKAPMSIDLIELSLKTTWAAFTDAVTNPTFTVNDRHVTLNYQFAVGDVLVLDFMAAPPKVTINGANSISVCTRDSTFVGMVLDVGPNLFTYSAESGDVNTMTVSIVHYDLYMGV